MSQHDMNIANQGFPAFRADLNDALGALVSNSSGATAPSTTFAHQFWVDTAADPSVLKIRNADNDAWIIIGSINQTDDKFKLTPADGVSTDTISELTSAAGVTIDGVLLKDTTVTANTIKASGTSSSQGEVQLFEDTDNGTNYVAIKAPASIASNVTWTLPDADGTANQVLKTDGSGVLGWANAGAGKVLQVVSTTKTDTFTMTGQAQTAITGLTATITPTSASSKILIIVSIGGFAQGTGQGRFILQRNSLDISGAQGASAGSRLSDTFTISGPTSGAPQIVGGIHYLDSPATTSSTTYGVTVSSNDAGQLIYINRSNADTDNSGHQRNISTITVMEIAG